MPAVAAVRKSFDYVVPAEMQGVEVGCQVRVVLHNRKVHGWVVATDVRPIEGVALSPLVGMRGIGPPPSVLEVCKWAAWRWAGSWSSFLQVASPEILVRALDPPEDRSRPKPVSEGTKGTRFVGPSPSVVDETLSGGTVILRLPPASDSTALLDAASRLVGGSGDAGVLVLAPSVRRAAQVADRLRRLGHEVALMPGDWAKARSGRCVVVGVRSAAFAPLPRLAAVVVLDAHDEGYRSEAAPTWCAWQVAARRAESDGAPCVLVSPCPGLEQLAEAKLVTMPPGEEQKGWPRFETVDLKITDPREGLLTRRVVDLVRWAALDRSRRVVCILNRKGSVRLSSCSSCRELLRCEDCSSAVELVPESDDRPSELVCRRCGTRRPVVCSNCGSVSTRALKVGVTRLIRDVKSLAGTAEVVEMSSDTDGEVGPAQIVIGTEAALHRVVSADAVIFLDFDSELLAPRLRASELSLALLARAGRVVATGMALPASAEDDESNRAGMRSITGAGTIIVQTRQPEDLVLQSAAGGDPGMLVQPEMRLRSELSLPPVTAMAEISGVAAATYADALKGDLESFGVEQPDVPAPRGSVTITGPVDGRWAVIARDTSTLCDLLERVARPAGRVRVSVDPFRA